MIITGVQVFLPYHVIECIGIVFKWNVNNIRHWGKGISSMGNMCNAFRERCWLKFNGDNFNAGNLDVIDELW